MKFLISVSILILVTSLPLFAQSDTTSDALKAMVTTEQAFSKTAEEQGTREAFLKFIADDGILFRPRAVKGKQWLLDHPVPPSTKRTLLAWQPSFADVSYSGDLGYTTGPWEFKDDIKNQTPSAYGDFVTVWRKQQDGSWKFVVDLGVGHPQSSGPLQLWQVPQSIRSKPPRSRYPESERKLLLDREQQFSTAAAKTGFTKSLPQFASSEVRVYRDGHAPFIGRVVAQRDVPKQNDWMKWTPADGNVSGTGDLGYTYGVYEAATSANGPAVERGNYLRIWKKDQGVWRVVLDVANPVKE